MHNKILTAIIPGSVTFTVVSAKSKWGAIWVPATGTPYMKMGAEDDRPIMPEPNSWDDVLLGGVLITLGMTVIAAADIIEMMFQTMLQSHMQNIANPHAVTYTQAGAEQAFSKNSAFNKNFGTGGTQVCVGDDTRLSDDRTPVLHDHTKHTDATRRLWIPGSALAMAGGSTFVELTDSGDLCCGVKISNLAEYIYSSLRIPDNIMYGSSNTMKFYVHYAYDDTSTGTKTMGMSALTIITGTTTLTPTYSHSVTIAFPRPAAPGTYQRIQILSIASSNWNLVHSILLRMWAASGLYAIYIIGIEIEYTGNM